MTGLADRCFNQEGQDNEYALMASGNIHIHTVEKGNSAPDLEITNVYLPTYLPPPTEYPESSRYLEFTLTKSKR